MRTAWFLSHVLEVMALEGEINLDAYLGSLPARRRVGRPLKPQGALTIEKGVNAYFDVKHLIKLLHTKPALCINWSLAKSFKVYDDETKASTEETFYGFVAAFDHSSPMWMWKVKFTDNDEMKMDVQELAEVLNYSHSIGVDITGPRPRHAEISVV